MSAARRAALEEAAQPAVTALQAARFDDARSLAEQALAADAENPRAAAVSALARYRQALHDLVNDALTIAASTAASAMLRSDVINQDFLDFALTRAEGRLKEIDALLATAEKDPGFSLDLCLACWEVDWNRSGEVDERDRRLFEVELDATGAPYELDDPRRRPTFRFDVADVAWLRAMVHFQRAVISVLAAYDPNVTWQSRNRERLLLKLRDGKKLLAAQQLLLDGLTHAEHCRQLVLAETDDEREWLPNPRQKNQLLPLPVDDALFETWGGVLADVRALVTSQQGLSVEQLAQLGRHRWERPPGGYLDVGALFTQPRDFVLDDGALREVRRDDAGAMSEFLGRFLGPSYKARMTPSPLVDRLTRMRREVDRGEDTFERKLRYLLWLN
jgi:hypothetical protein